MVRVGIAGIGFMGLIHYLAFQKISGARVTAICSRDSAKLAGDWRSIKGNFGPAGTQMDLTGVARYTDLDELIADPKLDLIDICLPPAVHASVAIKALQAGKHVICEKPIALSTRDARRMVETARRADRQLLVGQVLPYFPDYAYAFEMARKNKYGRLLGGHFKRIISDPAWLKDFWDPKQIGGPMLDLHVHDAHFIRLLFGMPRAVFTSGRMRANLAEFFTTQFRFEDPALAVSATSGITYQPGRSFCDGFEIHFERATLLHEFAVIGDKPEVNMPLTVLTKDGQVERPDLGAVDPVDAFVDELRDAVKAVRTGQTSPVLDAALACDAIELCQCEARSLASGRLVKV